jgi:hypothetical protein
MVQRGDMCLTVGQFWKLGRHFLWHTHIIGIDVAMPLKSTASMCARAYGVKILFPSNYGKDYALSTVLVNSVIETQNPGSLKMVWKLFLMYVTIHFTD